MNSNNKNSNLILFLALSFALILGWQYFFPPPEIKQTESQVTSSQTAEKALQNSTIDTQQVANTLSESRNINITTDNYFINLDEATGDILHLELLKSNDSNDEMANMVLLDKAHQYAAQSRLLTAKNEVFLANIPFKATATDYDLQNQDSLTVTLVKSTNDVTIKKLISFTKNSYIIELKYEIENHSNNPLELTAMYRLLHDGTTVDGATFFTHFYSGPVLYTPINDFEKIAFSDIADNKTDFPKSAQTGWLGLTQHYFSSIFILQPKNQASVCVVEDCYFYFNKRKFDNLYEVAFTTKIPSINANHSENISVELFSGPQEYKALTVAADKLPLVKDYGMWHIFANPLFLILSFIYSFVGNWGWAIILLVILLKIVFYPLTSSSARSMAKMRVVAPKLQELKALYGDDKVKMQQEMMALYKKEKINPIGGCLPMLLQIPIFIGLYWALFNSVELRQAPWIGWITDLSRVDPYYILPLIMAATMFIQTMINPPPSDPMQAKLMKIIPIVFSIMFFFFPSGLVLYWIVNNILTILQQWYVNKSLEKIQEK